MDRQDDIHYFVSRAAASRALAGRAAAPEVAAIHAELASRYDLLAAQTKPVGATTTTLGGVTQPAV